jgi:hypothetical protein
MPSEDDFRQAVADALTATNQFTEVSLIGLPEVYGEITASDLTAAAIEPGTTAMLTGWDAAPDGGRNFTCQFLVTVMARGPDPRTCDQQAEVLLNTLRNAVDGRIMVAGFNEPQKTMITGWRWLPRTAPERRIAATLTYNYLQFGWDGASTSP